MTSTTEPTTDSGAPITAKNGTPGPVKCTVQQRGSNAVASFPLGPGESKTVGTPAAAGMWIGFRDLENHPLASTLVGSTVSAVTLVQNATTLGIVQRQDPVTTTTIVNSTHEPVQAEMQMHGSSTIDSRDLAPIGDPAAVWDTQLTQGRFWVGYFSRKTGATLGSTEVDAEQLAEVALIDPRPEYKIVENP